MPNLIPDPDPPETEPLTLCPGDKPHEFIIGAPEATRSETYASHEWLYVGDPDDVVLLHEML